MFRKSQRFVSIPWFIAAISMALLIWANSMVAGEGSSALSLSVLQWARGALASLGLPYGWLTNFVVRKAAHVTEYAALGVLTLQALDPRGKLGVSRWLAAFVPCCIVAAVDETIQHFVPGRCGQITDVLIDSFGACLGIALRCLVFYVFMRRRSTAKGE